MTKRTDHPPGQPTPAPLPFGQDCGACGQPLTSGHICPNGSAA